MSRHQQTLEIIAKYIAEQNNIKIHLAPDITPTANPPTREIWLPSNVVEEHVFPTLALAIHEATHIKLTKMNAEEIVANDKEFMILNAMEDARIDYEAFRILPNVKDFYRELLKFCDLTCSNASVEARAVANCMKKWEGMNEFLDKDPQVTALQAKIEGWFCDGVLGLESNKPVLVKDAVQKISKVFGWDEPAPPKPTPDPSGQDKEKKDPEDLKESPSSKPEKSKEAEEFQRSLNGLLYNRDAIKTEKIPQDNVTVDSLTITEATRQRFEELLRVKENHLRPIESGNLNLENLTAFFTEDAEELFTENRVRRSTKSKILLLLDCSGSMGTKLYDNKKRCDVVASAAKSIIESIERVNESEGVCVDWDVMLFDDEVWLANKATWEKLYSPRGGTHILKAFAKAQQFLMKDIDLRGNKIMIIITDGEVDPTEVEEIRQQIIRHGSGLKLVIVGVGASPAGDFAKNIIHGRNILTGDQADQVLYAAIVACMEE